MHVAMMGTRGVPAAYGGFETAVEEIGRRLVDRGHEVTVYCRTSGGDRRREHLGMTLVHLPALRTKVAETLSHTALSAVHAAGGRRPDAAFVFNAANAPFLPLLRARGIPTALHMDGLEWKRDKWGANGRRYYLAAESLGVRSADALIADAPGIADYYDREFGVPTELLSYGAPLITERRTGRLGRIGLVPGGFHLVVARFEPENHVDVIVDGYHGSTAALPLVVVGSAPYAAEYTRRVEEVADADPRIRLLGGVFDQELLDELYANAATYLHGHSVGGTNPSLLRAMGAGTAVIAWDVGFNRGVLGPEGLFFDGVAGVSARITAAEADRPSLERRGAALRERAAAEYDWDAVAEGYEHLARRLAGGDSIHPQARTARRRRPGAVSRASAPATSASVSGDRR
jgi:glycosyltransferase involved in cell wall biosynthesis